MKKNKLLIVLLPFIFLFVYACEDYISNVDPVIDLAQDNLLNTEAQMDFLSKGVQQRFATTADQLACLMDLQSDAMIYTSKIATASFPTFEEIDKGAILPDNATVQGVFQAVGQLRKYADDLVIRVGKVTFTNDSKRTSALFTGYLYGGIARFYMAIAFGLTENQPGGVIDAGPFIPQSALLDDAVTKMKAALAIQTDNYLKKATNSLIAKAYLAKNDYTNAATYAAQGLVSGDKVFEALHNDVYNIYFWGFAGAGRVQIAVNSRFNNYVVADPKEAGRIKLGTVKGTDNVTYYWQLKYPDKFNNFPIMTWQENNLMIAECVLRGAGSGDALALVNAVRASRNLDPLISINIDGLMVERDKELFVQGDRLMDQNRTGTWHIPGNVWRYMPIPRNERNANPNLPPL
ncbi:MAG: RagB/SusD family nutrient uptake outer membrane protein [Melioribacter sp.]|nr:RagB/SusD family nutrient uptake outer membrane protein [Melioribacter sp.]